MRRKFITGIVALLPIGFTIFIIWFLVLRIGGLLKIFFRKIPALETLPPPIISLIGFLTLLVIIYVIGLITSSYIGNRVLKFGESIISKVPIIRVLYTSMRKFTNTVFLDRGAFKKVVLVEYPRKGLYTMGFMTNKSEWIIAGKKGYVNLFIPTSPNPTSGYYVIVPRSDIRETSLSIDSAMKTIVSGGVIVPKDRNV